LLSHMEILPLWGFKEMATHLPRGSVAIANPVRFRFPDCAHDLSPAGLFGVGALDEKRRCAWNAATFNHCVSRMGADRRTGQ
jgi:hypothetical protein